MSDPKRDDEAKFNETLKRMLDSKPKPHKPAEGQDNGASPKRGPKASK